MGEDYRVLGWLGKSNEYGIPSRAIYFQSALALAFIITGTFEQILIFSGLVLTLNNAAAVLGVIVLRFKQPDIQRPFKVPLYPIPAIIFLGVNAWIVVYLLLRKTENALPGLVLILVGLVMYWLFEKRQHAEKL
ncbi:MAG: hypothetical protein CUN56_15785 [Phototrophicales bacterium]|nr:MAG: hypothetical protein CUN56_15785 [Phototrophicales bacterium]